MPQSPVSQNGIKVLARGDRAAAVQKGEAAFGPITVLVNNGVVLGPIAKSAGMIEGD